MLAAACAFLLIVGPAAAAGAAPSGSGDRRPSGGGGSLAAEVHADTAAAHAYLRIHSALINLNAEPPPPPSREIEIGRMLFFDPRLSANGAVSCATCHNPGLGWADGMRRARGLQQRELDRHTPSLFYVNRNVIAPELTFFWDGRVRRLEEAVLAAIRNRLEMDRQPQELVASLNRIPAYVEGFLAVYGPAGITPPNVAKAIASFVKSAVRPEETPFDRFGRDPSALTPAQQRGLTLFAGKANCTKCHTGPFFSDDFFHNIGLRPGPGAVDPGRYAVTREARSWRAFRTPPLRNVAITPPYMHDGSIATLAEAVEFYDRGGDFAENRDPEVKPLGLSAGEKADLVAFLESLTSPQRPTAIPTLPPEEAPTDARTAGVWLERRLGMLRSNLQSGDRAAAAANARAFLETARDWTRLASPPSEAPAAALAPLELQRAAWDLAATAESAAALADVRDAFARLERALRTALKPAPWPPPAALSRHCSGGLDIRRLIADAASAADADPAAAAAIAGTMRDTLAYFQYQALLRRDPAVCDGLKGHRKVYAGISLPAEEACRERYHEDMLAWALVTRDPGLGKYCELSLRRSYTDMSREQSRQACRILTARREDPERACSELTPRYLTSLKHDSCVQMLTRLDPAVDAAACERLEGNPTDWKERCLAFAAFKRAHRARDPGLCGGHELCRALMGDAAGSARACAGRIRETLCLSLSRPGPGPR